MPELSVTHVYAASPERVYDAWLDPRTARRFLFATPTGEVVRCEIDARPGGEFTVVDRRPDWGDVEHKGVFEVLDRPRRIVFQFWVPADSDERTRVTVDIAPDGAGARVTLTHEGVLEEWTEQTRSGWEMILDALERALG